MILKHVVLQEGADQKTKKGLSYFNYNLVLGPVMLVAAYQSIAWIQDHAFWKALAAICVQTKRTDIAAYCFGRMQDAYGAELIEEAEKEPVSILRHLCTHAILSWYFLKLIDEFDNELNGSVIWTQVSQINFT